MLSLFIKLLSKVLSRIVNRSHLLYYFRYNDDLPLQKALDFWANQMQVNENQVGTTNDFQDPFFNSYSMSAKIYLLGDVLDYFS